MNQVYQGETLFVKITNKNSTDGLPIDMTGTTAEGRIDLPDGVAVYPATIDIPNGIVTLTVDRTLTKPWRVGKYDFQIWLDWGEGAEQEAEVLWGTELKVLRGL